MPSVAAVIVTRNRRDLLRECLDAVLAEGPDRVIVVDNDSDDGTPELLAERYAGRLEVHRMPDNLGGGGGFDAGCRAALAGDADWLWILDDDTIPQPGALRALVEAVDRAPAPPALLSSRGVWTDGSPHPMNEPWPRWTHEEVALDAIAAGLVEIRAATYVSILCAREAVEASGPPRPAYFIWGDDIEFTGRLLRDRVGYYVPESLVVHKTATNYRASRSDSPRYALDVRNKVWMLRSGDVWTPAEKWWWATLTVRGAAQYLRFNRWRPRAWAVVGRGLRAGLSGLPAH